MAVFVGINPHHPVELSIPLFAAQGPLEDAGVSLPPSVGTMWRLNMIRVDRSAAGISAASWNPISMGDFSAPDRMLRVVFADEKGAVPKVDERADKTPGP